MTDSSPEAEFVDGEDWVPPQKKEEAKTDRELRALELERSKTLTSTSSFISTSNSSKKTSRRASKPSRKSFWDLKRLPSKAARPSKSTSNVTSKLSSGDLARKPSPSQRSDVAPSSSNNLNPSVLGDFDEFTNAERAERRSRLADRGRERECSSKSMSSGKDLQAKPTSNRRRSSKKKKPKTIPLEILASNKSGGITKTLHVRKNAYTAAQSSVDQFDGDTQKQSVSLANTERQRNSLGDNDSLNNSMSMMCMAATQMDAGDFFSLSSDPLRRLPTIQNALAKYPTFTTGLAITMSSLVTLVKTPGYNVFAPESARNLPDFGDTSKGSFILNNIANNGGIVVNDGTNVSADNAHLKTVLILHPWMTHGNHDQLKTLKRRNARINNQRFDCIECNNAVAHGGGGKYCKTHKPEYCTVPYETWKTDRYDEMTDIGKSRTKTFSSATAPRTLVKWNGKKEDWNGCGAKVTASSGDRFLCANCVKVDNARRSSS